MRLPLLPALVAISLVTACQTGQPETERNPAFEEVAIADSVAPEVSPQAAAATAQRLMPLLKGAWVQKSYLDAVQRTKSPQQAWSKLTEVAEFHINPKDFARDSVAVGLSLGNHEGGQCALHFRPTRHAASLPLSFRDYQQPSNYYELDFGARQADSILTLNKYNRQHKLLTSVAYRRIRLPLDRAREEESLNEGLEQEVRRLLFVGQYHGQDSAGRALTARFLPNGTVIGLPGFQQYGVNTDFAAGPENNLDMLIFNLYSPQQRNFTFRFSHDTLRLYAVQPDAEHIDLRPAKLHYTLVRRR